MTSETQSVAFAGTCRTRLISWTVVLLLLGVGLWGGQVWWRFAQIQRIRSECARLQSERNWTKLLVAAQEWRSLEPGRREPLRAGATAGKALHQAAPTAEFLREFPCETKADVPWLTTLADLQFGPQQNPAAGAKTCKEILRLDPTSVPIRQRLIFWYAVTVQPVELQAAVHEAANQGADLPEFYVYAFLSDGLKLSNALDRIQKWMHTGKRDELLMVAYALNTARNLDGAIPSVDEVEAAAMRKSQGRRTQYLLQAREMFPQNHQLLAHDLVQAVEAGQTMSVADLLSQATFVADGDYRFWRARGWLFVKAGDLPPARDAFTEALRLHPLDWRTRYYFADWARRSNDRPLADQQYHLAAEGKKLETDLIGTSDVHSVSPELLSRLAEFVEQCGEKLIASRLKYHISCTVGEDKRLDIPTTNPSKSGL